MAEGGTTPDGVTMSHLIALKFAVLHSCLLSANVACCIFGPGEKISLMNISILAFTLGVPNICDEFL